MTEQTDEKIQEGKDLWKAILILVGPHSQLAYELMVIYNNEYAAITPPE